jgi:hypothetical protein
VYDKIRLEENGRLKITSALGQLEVAVVYYRQFNQPSFCVNNSAHIYRKVWLVSSRLPQA